MVSRVERLLCGELRRFLSQLPETEPCRDLQCDRWLGAGLERFVPEALCETHPEWKSEYWLDGVIPLMAEKEAATDGELYGLAYVLQEQNCRPMSPIHFRFQLDPNQDELTWFELRLGRRNDLDGPSGRIKPLDAAWYAVEWSAQRFDWHYQVSYGVRQARHQTQP